MEPQCREFTVIEVDGVLADLDGMVRKVAEAMGVEPTLEAVRPAWEGMVDPWLHLDQFGESCAFIEDAVGPGPYIYHCSRFPTKGKDPIQQTREWITKYVGDPSPIIWNEVS